MQKAVLSLLFAMAHVVGVRDSHTIIVDDKGALSAVTMKNVVVMPDEEAPAVDYLRRLVANSWVYVDNGDVYRAPDALYVNGDMNRHSWRTMRILGEMDLGVRPPEPKPKPASRGATASPTKSRRSARSR